MLRRFLVRLHRCCGLTIALFLIVTGLSGAVISWDHEVDDWLNTHLTETTSRGPFIDPLELAQRMEAADPKAWVIDVPLHREAGKTVEFGVHGRIDPTTGDSYELDYNLAYVDPVTGAVVGDRYWGAFGLDRERLVPFLYKLHYSLHLPEAWGIDWGWLVLGIISLIWTLDCFVGLALTLPRRLRQHSPLSWRQRWAPAWRIKRDASSYRRVFDIHRAVSLWLWGALLLLAFSSTSLNPYSAIIVPVVTAISELSPNPFTERAEEPKPVAPRLTYAEMLETAIAEGRRRNWAEPPGMIGYVPHYGIYYIEFYEAGRDHGNAGIGPRKLFYDGVTGALAGDYRPGEGSAGDIFVQLQFPLHSGRIAGTPGRIFVSALGLVVTLVTVTGVLIWWRKRWAARR